MALQKHGIGKSGQTGGAVPPTVASAPAAGAAPGANRGEAAWLSAGVGIVAALIAVVLVLLIRLMMRRRKAGGQPPSGGTDVPSSPAPVDGGDAAASRAAEASGDTLSHITQAAPAPAAATGVTAAGVAAASNVEGPRDEAQRDEASARAETQRDEPRPIEPQADETLDHATEVAGFDAAASLGADALPPQSIETARANAQEAERVERAEEARHEAAADAQAPHAQAEPPTPLDRPEPHEPPYPAEPASADEFAPQEGLDAPATPIPAPDATPPAASPAAPTEFPADAVAALDTLDMPLPPRVNEAGAVPGPTGPVASPETIERQSFAPDEPPAPPAGSTIEAGTAGAGSIAGLGAARFGTLSLDFDLDLPPDSAEPLPVFTPEQLARIARNKLDLAHEYIALGDLAGARTLINEVIESNDHATRADAQALLATLAPMS